MLDFKDMATADPRPRSRHRYTYEEYLAYERDSKLTHDRKGHLPRCFDGLRTHRRGSGGSVGRDDYQPDPHRGGVVGLDGGGGPRQQVAALSAHPLALGVRPRQPDAPSCRIVPPPAIFDRLADREGAVVVTRRRWAIRYEALDPSPPGEDLLEMKSAEIVVDLPD